MTETIESTLPDHTQLPETYAITLDNYSAISLIGEEQGKYLQGQVTCDVESLEQERLLTGAHCDAKGKVFSVFRLITHKNAHLLIQPKSSIAPSLSALQKFGVFAKVEITQADNLAFYAIAGTNAAKHLSNSFTQIPDTLTPVLKSNGITLVYISGQVDRYLVIGAPEKLTQVITDIALPVYPHTVWNLLEITEGFPLLSDNAISEYVPQMLNLQAINGISFTKGCYLGQETVARMQYLGRNKRALFALTAKNEATEVSANIIEKKLGDNWRKAGDVIAIYQASNNQLYIQAVLANDLEADTELRIKDQEYKLSLISLPYNLSTDSE